MKNIKIAYIGAGSKNWALTFMNDLTLNSYLTGEIALYDKDFFEAQKNQVIGRRMNLVDGANTQWNYQVYNKIDEVLDGADVVIISILPGTLNDMLIDINMPEEYGVYQSTGDTIGPGGIFRAMRTVPIFESFAEKIQEICPEAWVVNLTDPLYISTKTLYDVFPNIKAIGYNNELSETHDFLCDVVSEIKQIPRPRRNEIESVVSGISHCSWITRSNYKDINIMSLLPEFLSKHYESGYIKNKDEFIKDPYLSGNKVKMDLFLRFGALAASSDRHIVEFMNNSWYLKNKEFAESWMYHLTSVENRIKLHEANTKMRDNMLNGSEPLILKRSNDGIVDIIQSLMGFGQYKTPASMVNVGQMSELPIGTIVETQCEFDTDSIIPKKTPELPMQITNIVYRNVMNLEATYYGIKSCDFNMIFESFMNEPLCSNLTIDDGLELFSKMIKASEHNLKSFGI
ncbi:MAG: alpha-glucosidase/alpha-galactosidase [Clostridia bacterium]|nr:alpha-glucosidase/alpha-galactosidase [Clostridia bacterium]